MYQHFRSIILKIRRFIALFIVQVTLLGSNFIKNVRGRHLEDSRLQNENQ